LPHILRRAEPIRVQAPIAQSAVENLHVFHSASESAPSSAGQTVDAEIDSPFPIGPRQSRLPPPNRALSIQPVDTLHVHHYPAPIQPYMQPAIAFCSEFRSQGPPIQKGSDLLSAGKALPHPCCRSFFGFGEPPCPPMGPNVQPLAGLVPKRITPCLSNLFPPPYAGPLGWVWLAKYLSFLFNNMQLCAD